MTNYTYTDYTKFINELTVASNKTFDMSEVANLLYNVHGIKEEISVSRCYSGDKSPFLNVFLTKDGTFKFVSNFKNEKEFNDATESYYNQYFQEFEELVMRPFYDDGTIEPLSVDGINYDLIDVIVHADNYKLYNFKIGNEKHHYYYLPSYFVPLKKAKVLSVTKVKGSLDYKIRFRVRVQVLLSNLKNGFSKIEDLNWLREHLDNRVTIACSTLRLANDWCIEHQADEDYWRAQGDETVTNRCIITLNDGTDIVLRTASVDITGEDPVEEEMVMSWDGSLHDTMNF